MCIYLLLYGGKFVVLIIKIYCYIFLLLSYVISKIYWFGDKFSVILNCVYWSENVMEFFVILCKFVLVVV